MVAVGQRLRGSAVTMAVVSMKAIIFFNTRCSTQTNLTFLFTFLIVEANANIVNMQILRKLRIRAMRISNCAKYRDYCQFPCIIVQNKDLHNKIVAIITTENDLLWPW